MMFATCLLVSLAQAAGAGGPDATRVAASPPSPVIEIDRGKVKGDPARLAWSPDQTQVYVQMVERDRKGVAKVSHFIVTLADKKLKRVDAEPQWAARYWAWKSAQAAPGAPAFKIAVDFREELVKATATPMGGNLARGDPGASGGGAGAGAGLGVDEAQAAANQTQRVGIYTLSLKGEMLGEWKNEVVVPGLTFGWAPAGFGLVAFASSSGDLVLMDEQGRKQKLAGTRDVVLPAWSDDGARIAYLSKSGRKTLTLYLTDVARS